MRLQLLHHPFALQELYVIAFSMLSTSCIKATVHIIRYFNWQKSWVAFHPINWQLTQSSILAGLYGNLIIVTQKI